MSLAAYSRRIDEGTRNKALQDAIIILEWKNKDLGIGWFSSLFFHSPLASMLTSSYVAGLNHLYDSVALNEVCNVT